MYNKSLLQLRRLRVMKSLERRLCYKHTRSNRLTDLDMQRYERNSNAHKAGMTPDEVAQYYSKWSPQYEQDLCEGVYNGPAITAKEVASIYPVQRENIHILDVAAGTGLLGLKLHQHGFRKLSALDPAEGMLELCKKKEVYQEFVCQFMTGDQLPINNDTYDCIAISGGMGESHLPKSALSEMVRIVKPGGHICIVMRREYLDYVAEYNEGKLQLTMDDLELAGKWKKVTVKLVKKYSFQKDGIVFIYQVK